MTSTDTQGGRFAAQNLVGQMIDNRYAIRELIARGGTSVIYRAQDIQLQRTVALKVIMTPRTTMLPLDEDRIRRLKREGLGLAQMDHPNIVPVFDTGIDESTSPHYDIYYIAMKLMEGETLEEKLKELEANGERMPWRQVLKVIHDVSTALNYAHGHELRFVHRDVKPSNILLADDRAYLFDFGLLKILGTSVGSTEYRASQFSEFTLEGSSLGTPAYWSPEQIKGAHVDERADIYALGGVLYRMLTGRLAYQADDAISLSIQHLNEPPPRPSDVDPTLFAFDPIVTRAMAKDPADRYISADSLVEDLEASLDLTPDPMRGLMLATAQGAAMKIPRWLGGLLGMWIVVALALFVGVRYLNWFQPPTDLPLGWQSSIEQVSMVEVEEGEYSVTVRASNASYTIFREGERLENLHASLEAELRSGPGETAYGLVFQRANDSDYYAFAITGAGQVGALRRKGDSWLMWEGDRWVALAEAKQAWVSRKYIHTDRPNRLDVTVEGGRARGWVNNQPEFEFALDGTRPGNIGFFVSTSREARDSKATIRFTGFTVRR